MKVNKYVLNSCITALILSILLVSFYIVIKVGSNKKIKAVETTTPEVKDQITISFDSNGGTAAKDIKISKNGSVKLPTVSKSGYKFLGWYLDDTKVSDKTKFIKDTKLKAKWEKVVEEVKTFKVTFNSKGGSTVAGLTVECGKELELPKAPTREGYEFVSWVDKNDTPILDGALLTCDDITLYANWKQKEVEKEVKTITISFNTDGGTSVSSVVTDCSKGIKLPNNPTKDDYEFVNWTDDGGNIIHDGTAFTCDKDVTLTANWKKIEKEEPKEEENNEENKEEDEKKD